jgi:hypothetical protein
MVTGGRPWGIIGWGKDPYYIVLHRIRNRGALSEVGLLMWFRGHLYRVF